MELDLSDNRDIGEEGSVAIARGLTDNRSIKGIKLRSCALSSEFGRAFGQALAANRTLLEFDLYNNPLGIEGTKGIAEGLKRNATIEEFKSDYHLTPCERHIGFEAVADLIAQNTNLRKLVVTCGPCSPASLSLLAEALKRNTHLEHLELQQIQPCQGVKEGILQDLAEVLKSHPVLHTVILNQITIEFNAIALFADALTANPTIIHLDLSGNPIDKEGLATFAQALKKSVGLRSLCLEYP
ncbi:MAG: hypothetical protein LLG04_15700 [Parachlamydia sp.]|nr:hypothetical protein [Parachlamydia sp.]